MTDPVRMRAAIDDAIALHQPSVLAAGEYEDGTCAYCQDHPDRPLIKRFRDYLNGSHRKVWMHAHPDEWPICSTCASGWEDRASWPCATYSALAAADAGLALVTRGGGADGLG